MEAIASRPLAPRWKGLLSLSTRRPPEFYEKSDDVENVPHAGALRTTFDRLGASAVFCVQHVPTVVILSLDEYDPARVAPIQAALWNQGLASLLVVISGDTVRVFTLARIPRCGTDNDHFRPEERVDRVLLDNLTASHRLLREAALPAGAAQALLIQAMFVAYLEDREIIGGDYFRAASEAGAGDFETLLESGDVSSFVRLFETLRKDFNGDLFVAPCSFDEHDRGPRLQTAHLAVLARFRAGREEMHRRTGQYRLWRYDFKYIPIELISAVHDRFLGERGPERRTRGAYYTPMFLADTVVSHVWDGLPPPTRDRGCFLDPACGSGIFLVRLFQRLCEHRRETGGERTIRWDDLVDVLSRLKGRDLDGVAVRVAVFSLYVALLEEVTPPDIRKLMQRGEVLPALHGKTLRNADFFADAADDPPVDVVVGNRSVRTVPRCIRPNCCACRFRRRRTCRSRNDHERRPMHWSRWSRDVFGRPVLCSISSRANATCSKRSMVRRTSSSACRTESGPWWKTRRSR